MLSTASSERRANVRLERAQINRHFRRQLALVAGGFAGAALAVIELLHLLLVPHLRPYTERIVAEAVSGLILGVLAAILLYGAYKARQHTLAHLQMIAEVNHHVRNALEVISLSAYMTQDENAIRRITEGVNRIDWVLREVLPRENFAGPSGNVPGAPSTGALMELTGKPIQNPASPARDGVRAQGSPPLTADTHRRSI